MIRCARPFTNSSLLSRPIWDFRIKGEQGDPVRTFSREALQATVDAMGIFVAARLSKRWTDPGLAPRELSVRISVDICRLRFAIANKRLIRFTYESAERIAEPHDYGLRDGVPKLLAYERQRTGRKDQRARGWRWLDLPKIQDCIVLDDSFSGTRETANQHHHLWDVLYARVDHET